MRKQSLISALAALLISSSLFAQSNIQSLIKGERGISKEVTRLPEEEQVAFAPQNAAKLLGLDANSDLRLLQQERDQQGINYRFQQTIHGIPVENSMFIIQTQNGIAKVMSGSIITESDPAMTERLQSGINSATAIKNAVNHVHATRYAWEDTEMERQIKSQSGIDNKPTAEVVWYNLNGSLEVRDLKLAYKVIVYALEPLSRAAYFVDAVTGKVLGSKDLLYYTDATGTAATAYSGTQTIHSDLNGASYRLRDLTKGSGVVTVKGTGAHADYSSTTANWSFTTNDKYALDAHYGVSQTWSFYNANFGRNSVNNAGFTLTSYVNETSTVDNAYWDGSIMHFGVRSLNSAGIVGIDVTGHELTHGVTQYTSNLNYSGESGAMNESMSDIMGKAVQFWSKPTDINWLLSNDMNWAIRNMANLELQTFSKVINCMITLHFFGC
jgi:Zn-dependent metalloprotease